MFRSLVITRNEFIKNVIRKQIRNRISRGLSSECVRRGTRQCINTFKNRPLPLIWNQYITRSFADYPSHTAVRLPALSPTMETGTIVSWAKKEGDKLNEGDLLAEIETDKATMGFETPEEGYLAKILVPAGTKDVPIGKIVCIITENQSEIAAFKDFKDEGAAAAAAASKPSPPPTPSPPSPAPAPVPTAAPTPSAPTPTPAAPAPITPSLQDDRPYASPMAKRLAEMHNIRLQGKGSGIFGSIKSSDLSKLEKAPASAAVKTPTPVIQPGASYVDIPVSNIRGVIAKRLVQSKTTIPHYYLTREINIDKLSQFRSIINKELEKQKIKLSFNDFIIKTVAAACNRVPEVNAAWMDTFIRQYNSVDVSVAVATDRGLITPIVFNADRKGILAISQDMKTLASKAKENKLQPNEFQGGTISISNLGMFDITQFCAIINPPQAAILACGGIVKRVIAVKDGQFKEAPHMIVTLSCDHRVIDGAVGAQWLQAFADGLSDPARICL